VGRIAATVILVVSLWTAGFSRLDSVRDGSSHIEPAKAGGPSTGCMTCHAGIEQMHPWSPVSCVDCHGGNGTATTVSSAHVAPAQPLAADERVAPLDADLAYRRFLNPTDLRVVGATCAPCHPAAVAAFRTSLHGTTAGHLSDGLYENGVTKKKGTSFAIFRTTADGPPRSPFALKEMPAVPGFQPSLDPSEIPTHYRDVVRKNCMHCHAWSRGRAVRGRLGMDGDYRSEGCASCHVTYSDVGFSESADQTINHREPGHPLKHEMTVKIPTDTCTRCHYGDASIGLSFRGLAQLVPGQPAGPDVPGTTSKRLNGTFYLRDDLLTPPDVHHTAGMQCIDCHTARDAMGDGDLHATMDHAVEIECTTCHGTFEAPATMKTARGSLLATLSEHDGSVFLTSKVTGKRFRVKQARNVIDPLHADFNAAARDAMTGEHASLECYACHAGWTPNFFGFHFDRNESFTQLDLISGQRTPGRVNTLEKVFSTFKHLQLGINHEGAFAPYMVGFSTFCTAHDGTGKVVVDQKMPRTAAGLSGMTMIHHQPHTTQATARSCAECHRSGVAWGLGSGSFDLARGLVAAATPGGVALLAVDRKSFGQSEVLAEVPMPDVRDVALVGDPIEGFAEAIYAATAAGVSVISAANPAFPEVRHRVAVDDGAVALAVTDRTLYVAARRRGVLVLDLKDRMKPEIVARIPAHDARGLALHSLHLYVADGSKGLTIADVSDPRKPAIVSTTELLEISPTDPGERGAERVAVFFQNSRPRPGDEPRSRARMIAAVAGYGFGLHFLDVTEPSKPFVMDSTGPPRIHQAMQANRVVGLEIASKFDLGSTGGGIPSAEHDYLYLAVRGQANALLVIRVTDPLRPVTTGQIPLDGAPTGLAVMRVYNPPFLVHALAVPSARGMRIVDVSRSDQPQVAAKLEVLPCSGGVAVEAMPLDRMITEEGVQLKDIAHEPARYVTGAELRRMLRAKIPYNEPDVIPRPTPRKKPESRPR
jgi:hypothetical protein